MLSAPSIYLSYLVSNATCALVITVLWAQNRGRFSGLNDLLASYFLNFAGIFFLSALRSIISDFTSIVIGNSMVVLGAVFLYSGAEKFSLGKANLNVFNYLVFTLFVIVHGYFTFVFPSLQIRIINISLATLLIYAQCMRLFFAAEKNKSVLPRRLGLVFATYCIFALARIAANIISPPLNDSFKTSIIELYVLIGSQGLFILLTFSLFLMINRKLLADAAADIAKRELAEKDVRESEERLAAVIAGGRLGYSDWNIQTGEVTRNERWAGILGYTLHEINASYAQWEDLMHPDDLESARNILQDHLDGRTYIHRDEYRLRAKEGGYRWILDQGKIVKYDSQGLPLRMTATHTDVTERKQAEEKLQKQYQYLSALQETTLELISEFDLDILLENIVRRAEALVETESGFIDLVDLEDGQLKPHIGLGLLAEAIDHVSAKGEGVSGTVWQTGKPVLVANYDEWGDRVKKFSLNTIGSILGVPLLSGDKVLGVLGLAYSANSERFFGQDAIDILVQFARLASIAIENARLFSAAQRELVERKAAEVKLKQANDLLTKQIEEIKELQSVLHELSIRDPLTSAYNRRYMEEALKQEYARAQRKKYPISIIILDLDNLKDINDTYGHMTGGDQALQTLAHQLQAMCRAEDVICRYGGDEFLIILRDASAQVAYERAVKWLESVGNSKISYNNMDFKITFSAGIAEFPANGKNMEDIILAADYALYAAKDAGRNCVKIFKKTHE